MKKNNVIIVLVVLLTIIIFAGCCPSNYIKIEKSTFIPDEYEINRDELITHCVKIGAMGQRYFNKPVIEGGGSGSFIGFSIPGHVAVTSFGEFEVYTKEDRLKVVGKGKLKGYDGYNPMEVEIFVSPDQIVTSVIRN